MSFLIFFCFIGYSFLVSFAGFSVSLIILEVPSSSSIGLSFFFPSIFSPYVISSSSATLNNPSVCYSLYFWLCPVVWSPVSHCKVDISSGMSSRHCRFNVPRADSGASAVPTLACIREYNLRLVFFILMNGIIIHYLLAETKTFGVIPDYSFFHSTWLN